MLDLQFLLTQTLLLEGKPAEALRAVNEVYPAMVQRYGEDSHTVLMVLGVRQGAEAELLDWDHAIPDSKKLLEHARRVEPTGFMTIGSAADLALMECRGGRPGEGEEDARAAWKAAVASGQSVGLQGNAKYVVASCILLHPGKTGSSPARLEEAERLLDVIPVPAVAIVTAIPAGEPT